MPRRKVVPRLKRLAKGQITRMCYQIVQQILSRASRNWSISAGDNSILNSNEDMLNKLIRDLREYLIEGMPHDLGEYVCSTWLTILSLVIKSYEQVPSSATLSFKSEHIFVTARLAEIGAWGGLTKLDLVKVSKQIRSPLYASLGDLTRLQILNLGSGIGNGWLSVGFLNQFYSGVKNLRHLKVFRDRIQVQDLKLFQNDCTNLILTEVLRNCGHSLRAIDVQFSRFVDDASTEAFLTFCPPEQLQELSLSGTGISDPPSTLRLLEHFSCLKRISIENSDRVLRHLSHIRSSRLSSLKYLMVGAESDWSINDKMSLDTPPCQSLQTLSKVCPALESLVIDLRLTPALRVDLQEFTSIQELTLLGGSLSSEQTHEAIHLLGNKLHTLTLVHSENINCFALLRLAKHCERLRSLNLTNCSLHGMDEERTLSQMPTFPWPSLERLTIQFPCDHDTLRYMLLLCPNLRELRLGISTQFSDDTISSVLKSSSLALRKLQTFNVAFSELLTMFGIFHLIHHCPGLFQIQDLSNCSQISAKQVISLRRWTREHNLLLNV
ncbi:hypothetical protein TCAL_10198, partial [Tigriopus californicus]